MKYSFGKNVLLWCADNLTTLLLMLLHLAMDTLDWETAPSGWMMCSVVDMRAPCSNVQLLHLVIIIVLTLKMLVFDVEVDIMHKLSNQFISCLGGGAIDPFTLRLFPNPNTLACIIEVYLYGAWGTVCRNGFDQTAANVACRELGYPSGGLVLSSSLHLGEGLVLFG